VSVGQNDGTWTVKFANAVMFQGDKRKALFFAAKVALIENAPVVIEPDVQFIPKQNDDATSL